MHGFACVFDFRVRTHFIENSQALSPSFFRRAYSQSRFEQAGKEKAMRGLAWIVLGIIATAELALAARDPLVIAHRGASGYRPEHTLSSYQLALDMGSDFIEPDLVITKDGELIARHEPNLMETTDVRMRPEFADRHRLKLVDGVAVEGFFAEDFTLAEIKTLRAIQSRPYRDQSYNGVYSIPTLAEIIRLVQDHEKLSGRAIGIYPELKHPSYFRLQGLPLEEKLIDTLIAHDFVNPLRVYIQSFEVSALKDVLHPLLQSRGLHLPLIQLFDALDQKPYDYVLAGRPETYGDLIRSDNLALIVAGYARGIGVWKASFIKRERLPAPLDLDGDGVAAATERLTGEILPVVSDAHSAGLLVHVYTMRNEEQFLALGYASAQDEYRALAALGVDGFFTDFPDTARIALRKACSDRLP
jgi:glycerophosphoryl diester phosphodiesterase